MDRKALYESIVKKYKDDDFPYLSELTDTQLCSRRYHLTKEIARLEKERREIDEQILSTFSDAELKHGVRIPEGMYLRARTRTSYTYSTEVTDQITSIRSSARDLGEAMPSHTKYLVMTAT